MAVGLALKGLTPAGQRPNFLNADTSHADLAIWSSAKRAVLVAAVLRVVILGLVGVNPAPMQATGVMVGKGSRTARSGSKVRASFERSGWRATLQRMEVRLP